MKKISFVVLASVIGFCSAAFGQTTLEPPKLLSAGDAYVPYTVANDGFFVLDVSLTGEGKVERVDTLRDPGAMFPAANKSVKSWNFQAASQDGKQVASRLTVAFVYRPPNFGIVAAVPPKNFVPVIPPTRTDVDGKSDYVPVGIVSFDYPEYLVNSVAWGSVIVQVTVNEGGRVRNVAFLHSMAGFNHLVTDALKKWYFQPATFKTKPVTATIVIAFVFQPPASN
jgi:TonB family protein